MTEQISLKAEERSSRGKISAKQQRRKGFVPGVYYDRRGDNIPLTLGYGALHAAYTKAQNRVIYLQIRKSDQTSSSKPALIQEIQFHPVKGLIEHIDFVGVDLSQEVNLEVPLEFTGKSQGVDKGGKFQVYRENVPVSCLPESIPTRIEVDVSDMDIGDNLYHHEVSLPEGVTVQETSESLLLVHIEAP